MSMIDLGTLQVKALDYAAQGNAILGIRDSGKTHTAMYMAERLLDDGIPIVAFDPVGVWSFLRVGRRGHKGYPVVVAGGNRKDLPLTVATAPDIVRAAMHENIPLVLDLYDASMSKADWRRIVAACVRVLVYENAPHGMRHIFIEEAAEFVPQFVRGQQGEVYAEMEKLARMGRNFGLGYTMINQRSEEVNKAVLELCDCLFLHRQKGRHSLTGLSKWLDVASADNRKEVIESMPALEQGECWVWMSASMQPIRTRIPEKNTILPNPKTTSAAQVASGIPTDVSAFVGKLKATLAKIEAKKPVPPAVAKAAAKQQAKGKKARPIAAEPELVTMKPEEWTLYEQRLTSAQSEANQWRTRAKQVEEKLEKVRALLRPQFDSLSELFAELAEPTSAAGVTADKSKWDPFLTKLGGSNRRMLELLIEHGTLTDRRICFLIGVPMNRTYYNWRSKLNTLGLITRKGNEVSLREF